MGCTNAGDLQYLHKVPLMSNSAFRFEIGDKVVYPNHGVGIIEQISSRTMGSSVERFYLLRFNYNSMTVMVPFSQKKA